MRGISFARVALAFSVGGVVAVQSAEAIAADQSEAISEVVVTAQRREQNLKDVPLAVTAVSADELQSRNFTDPSQLQYVVPSLQLTSFQASPGATNFSIRGVGTQSFSHLIEPSVSTVIDGVVMGRPEMGVMEFSDLERVEVLEGPQGMLFGKNASAGLVNIVTTRPKLGVNETFGRISYANIDAANSEGNARAQVTTNVAMGDTAAARISGYYTDTDGLVDNVFSNAGNFGHKQYGVRAKFLMQPSDALTAYFSADYSGSDGIGSGAMVPRSTGPGSQYTPSDVLAGVTPGPDNLLQSSNANTDLHYQVGGAQAQIDFELSNGLTLTSISAYRQYNSHHTIDFDLRQVNIVDISAAAFDFDQFTQELRLASAANADYDYQLGVFYYDAQSDRRDFLQGNLQLGAPPPGFVDWIGIHANNNLKTESYAAYGQGSRKFGDRFRLTAGARFTKDRLHLRAVQDQDGYPITIAGEGGTQTYSPTADASDVSGRISGQYEITSAVTTYATVSRGYKGPGFNLGWSGVPGALPVGKETSTNYEVGVKSSFDGWMINATAYHEKFDDFQVQAFRPGDTPTSGAFIIQNAASAVVKGVEAQVSYRTVSGFSFSSGVNYNDATYDSFRAATCYPGQSAAQGCLNGVTDATGHQISNAPRLSATFAANYERALSDKLTGFVHGDVFTRSKVFFDPSEDPNTRQGGYGIFNASLALGDTNDRWKASLYCANCFDRRFTTFIQAMPGGGPGDYNQTFAMDSFRSIGVAIDMKF